MFLRLLLVAMLAVGVASAQRGGGGGGGGMPMGFGPPAMPAPLDRIVKAFSFNNDEKKDVKTAIDAVAKEAAPVREQILKGRAQLLAAVTTGADQDALKKLVNAQAELMAKMTHLEMQAFAKVVLKAGAEQRRAGAGSLFAMIPGIFMKKNWNSN